MLWCIQRRCMRIIRSWRKRCAGAFPVLTRAQLLGQIMRNYQDAVAIAGTHGKTTTTSMVTEILLAAGADPTISVGGILHSIGGNVRIGQDGCFVTEACEYTNSYHALFPTVEVILNIREDHLDFFRDPGGYQRFIPYICEAASGGRHADHQRGYPRL